MMLNNLLSKLPALMKEQEPDFKSLFGEDLKKCNIELLNPVVVQRVSTALNSDFSAGVGLQNLSGTALFQFKNKFNVKITGDDEVTLMVDQIVRLTFSKGGISAVEGVNVDGPGPLNPSLKSILIEGKELVIKVGPITKRLPLPEQISSLM